MLGLGNSLIYASSIEQQYSLSLDGTGDYLNIGNVLNLGTADFSISLWFKVADMTNQYLMGKKEDTDNQILIIANAADKIYVQVENDVSGAARNLLSMTGAGAMTALQNTWVHCCITCDRDGQSGIYINGTTGTYGKALVSTTNGSDNQDNSGSWTIGKVDTSHTTGKIDEVAIWNVALDADAVTAIYNSGIPFDLGFDRGDYDNSSALQGYWRMNDGSGTTVVDSAGSNNGTLAGDATFSPDTADDSI